MAATMCGTTKMINEDEMTEFSFGPIRLLRMLQERHERAVSVQGHCEAMLKAVKLESPKMDDDFIVNAVEGMKAAGTWESCGEWAGLIKARLGQV